MHSRTHKPKEMQHELGAILKSDVQLLKFQPLAHIAPVCLYFQCIGLG